MIARPLTAAALALSSLACGVEGAARDGVTVRDSAGIEIVESTSPRWSDGEAWSIADTPAVSIGSSVGGDPATEIGSVAGLTRLRDGGIVVLDGRASEIRIFDSTGAHVRTVGRKGRGPGEFGTTMLAMERLRGDTLLVREVMPPRQQLFAPTGRFVRDVPGIPVPGSLAPATATAHFDDGAAILSGMRAIEERTGTWLDSMPYFVTAPGADTAIPLGRFPFQHFSGDGRMIAGLAFGPIGRLVAAGDRFWYGFPERFEIAQYTRDGRLTRLIRRAWSPVAVPQRLRDAHRDSALGRASTPVMRDRVNVTQYAENFPAYEQLHADLAGNLWVRAARTDESVLRGPVSRHGSPSWSVFDPNGAWLGDVRMPQGFEVREIGSDYVAGAWYDENDVPIVRVYRLHKP